MSSDPCDLSGMPEEEMQTFEECSFHGRWLRSVFNAERKQWYSVAPSCPECLKDARLKKLQRHGGIHPRFAHCTFESYLHTSRKQQLALSICHDYAKNFKDNLGKGKCLVFQGSVGTGKTHLACSIARYISQNGYSSLLVTVFELIGRIRAAWNRNSIESETEIIAGFAEVDLLILDEVGIQYGTESEKITLFQVIDARYRAMKPTIIISNLQVNEVQEYLGKRAYDRLRENGGSLVTFEWASYRGPG